MIRSDYEMKAALKAYRKEKEREGVIARAYCKRVAMRMQSILILHYSASKKKAAIEESITDAITDLMHLASVKGIGWEATYQRARNHHNAEIMGGQHG